MFTGVYSDKADAFSVGVILFILATGEMPFECRDLKQYQGSLLRAEKEGLDRVLNMKGDRLLGRSPPLKDLINKLLSIDPRTRLTAIEALAHPWLNRSSKTPFVKQKQPVPEIVRSSTELRKQQRTDISTTGPLCSHPDEALCPFCSRNLNTVDKSTQTFLSDGLRRVRTFGVKWF